MKFNRDTGLCDICGKHRAKFDHTKCSAIRKATLTPPKPQPRDKDSETEQRGYDNMLRYMRRNGIQ